MLFDFKMSLYVQRQRGALSHGMLILSTVELSTLPQFGFIPPHRPDCKIGREAGPLSREGRSLCGQAGQSHPEGWVLRQWNRKTHLFSLLRTRWNVMV